MPHLSKNPTEESARPTTSGATKACIIDSVSLEGGTILQNADLNDRSDRMASDYSGRTPSSVPPSPAPGQNSAWLRVSLVSPEDEEVAYCGRNSLGRSIWSPIDSISGGAGSNHWSSSGYNTDNNHNFSTSGYNTDNNHNSISGYTTDNNRDHNSDVALGGSWSAPSPLLSAQASLMGPTQANNKASLLQSMGEPSLAEWQDTSDEPWQHTAASSAEDDAFLRSLLASVVSPPAAAASRTVSSASSNDSTVAAAAAVPRREAAPSSGLSKGWEDLAAAVQDAVLAITQGPCSPYIKVGPAHQGRPTAGSRTS